MAKAEVLVQHQTLNPQGLLSSSLVLVVNNPVIVTMDSRMTTIMVIVTALLLDSHRAAMHNHDEG